jgi:hypothetical protein
MSSLLQDNIVGALKKEYWRRPDFPTELEGSEARKKASYKEGKVLKYYEVTNRLGNLFQLFFVFLIDSLHCSLCIKPID